MSAFAFQQRGQAQANFTRAEAQRLAAEAQRLLAEGGTSDTIALLSIRSLKLDYTTQGDLALAGATARDYATATLGGYEGVPLDAIVTPDGATIISADINGTLIFWDRASQRELRRFLDPRGGSALAIASDGATLYTGGRAAGTITARDSTTLAVRWAIDTDTGRVLSLDVSRDGRYLLSTSVDQMAHLWDAATGRELQHWPIVDLNDVPEALFLPDSMHIVVADGDGLSIRRIDSTAIERKLPWSANGPIAVSQDGRYVLVGGAPTARLYDLVLGQAIRQFSGHRDGISGVAIAPDNRTIATASTDLSVRLWDLTTGAELRQYLGHTGNLFGVHYTPDGQQLLSTSFDRTLRIWEVTGHRPAPVFVAGGHVSSVAVSSNGQQIATGSNGSGVQLWDRASTRRIRQLSPFEASELAFSPDGQFLLANLSDRTTRLWRVPDGAEIWQTASFPGAPGDFGFSPDGRLALVFRENSLDLVQAQDAKVVFSIPATEELDSDFSPDGTLLAVADGNPGTVTIWNTRTGAKVRTLGPVGTIGMYSVAFGPDAHTIATGGTDNLIRMWDVARGQELQQLQGHTDVPWDLAFSRDGHSLMSSGLDNTIRLWDLRQHTEIRRYGHQGRVYAATFMPGDQAILTGSVDGTARIWDVSLPRTIDTLCHYVQRDFNEQERQLYNLSNDSPTCPAEATRVP